MLIREQLIQLKRQKCLRYADWQVYTNPLNTKRTESNWINRINEYNALIANPDSVFKSDHRSKVSLFSRNEVRYVVKEFTLQKTWFWFKLTSLLFKSLGEVAWFNSLGLQTDGIPVPEPELLMQRISWGMVVESRMIYRFVEGDPLTVDNYSMIIAFIREMHKAGWIHRDPHPANFIRADSGVVAIDPIRARRSGNVFFHAYDAMLIARDIPEARCLYGRETFGVWYSLAEKRHWLMKLYRKIKHFLRGAAGLPANKDVQKGRLK